LVLQQQRRGDRQADDRFGDDLGEVLAYDLIDAG
jgi:hypothetical protein